MTNCKMAGVILAALVSAAALRAEEKGVWVTDWANLSESAHIVKSAKVEGVVEGTKGQSYSLNVETRTVSSGELKKNATVKYYGPNRRGDNALNAQMTSLELVVGEQKMKVSEIALTDILNPLIGERMEMVFSRDEHHIKAIVINGPDGAEGYMVAFIFEDGKFSRRQIRSNTATANGWPLLEDKRY
jgi:hypothetical protein